MELHAPSAAPPNSAPRSKRASSRRTAMTRFDSIETERLVLRRWRNADRGPFAELNGDPETLVFFPSTLTRAESDALVDRIEARFEAHGYGLWALEVRQTGQFVGFTGLAPMPDDVPGAGGTEIGWGVGRDARAPRARAPGGPPPPRG